MTPINSFALFAQYRFEKKRKCDENEEEEERKRKTDRSKQKSISK